MYKDFAAYIEKERLFAGCKRLLLAVSGGVDSVVLTHLVERYRRLHPDLEAAWVHCNFHLRGEESERDEAFVRDWAQRLGCRLYVKSFDTEAYAQERRVSIEMAARDLRYAYFAELMDAEAWDACLLAHHADDNAETFFINLFRGSGVKGLRGMLPRAVSKGHIYLRPLLFSRRSEIMAYAQEHALAYVEDSTNRQEIYLRNRVRLSLLPFMDSVQPGAVRKITQSMETLRAADALIDDWFSARKAEVVKTVSTPLNAEALSRAGLKAELRMCPVARQEALLLAGLDALGRHKDLFLELYLRERGFNRAQIAQILQNERAGTAGKVFENSDNSGFLLREPLGWRWVALKDGGLRMAAYPSGDVPESDGGADLPPVASQGNALVQAGPGPACRLEILSVGEKGEMDLSPDVAYLAFSRLQFPLYWRHWRPGDRFKPLGLKGFKKLSDFFSDLKLGRMQKDDVWLLCSGNDIAWVAGYRIDDRYKLDFSKTGKQEALMVSLLRLC